MSSDPAERFRRLIRRQGPISVAQFMGESNTLYYASRDPLGVGGDFITAPEISQMFGEMLGAWIADVWSRAGKPDSVAYVELGPGRGTLANDALRVMAGAGLRPEVHLVEGSPELRSLQRQAVPQAQFHDDLASVPDDMPLLLLANEFFDALPVRQLVKTETGWRERMIGLTGDAFTYVSGDNPMDAAVPEAFADSETGSIVETCPAAAAVMRELAQRLAQQGGAALVIDYGYEQLQTGSTLQAVKAHEKVDPLCFPGEADLTAHVDFGALGAVASKAGAVVTGIAGQGPFLETLGLAQRASALASRSPDRIDEFRVAHRRLAHPDEMGSLFKVLGLSGAGWPEGAGFPA